jgi:DNA-binding transcriptional regulator YiaG
MESSGETLIEEVQMPSFEGLESDSANLASARKCVDWMVLVVRQLNRKAGFEMEMSAFIHDLVISSSSQAAILWNRRLSEQARTSLVHSWLDQSLIFRPSFESMRAIRNQLVHQVLSPSEKKLQPLEMDREFLRLFSLAAAEKLRAESSESQARQSLRNVLSRLELSTEDLARILSVTSEDIEEWELGRRPIRTENQAIVNRASSAVMRLSAIFRPDRLPQVIRRKVELFDGQTALDWILQGRIDEVADRYEASLAYQG